MSMNAQINSLGNTSQIQSLTEQGNSLSKAIDSWNSGYVWLGAAALLVAFFIFFAQWKIIRKGKELSAVQSDLIAAKDRKATLDSLATAAKIAELNVTTALATEKAAEANLELARITGQPYLITVKNGVAKPDLSQSNKQVVRLTGDTVVELPTLPKGKHFDWTLSLIQNEAGGHRFKFSPDIGQFDPNVDVSPRTGWLVHFQTDETGTKSVGWGGVRIDAPAGQ